MTTLILQGDCRVLLRGLAAKSVQLVVTSPPYYGLRSYGSPPLIWGGDEACAHDFVIEVVTQEMRKGVGLAVLGERMKGGGHKQGDDAVRRLTAERGFCRHCCAWQGHYGLEPTWVMYVEHTVEIFREVWRVLRDDGSLFLNLGDCYATGAGASNNPGGRQTTANGREVDWGYRSRARGGLVRPAMGKHAGLAGQIQEVSPNRMPQPGMRAKNKMLIPARVAIALQDDGWILRQDNIWFKLNPMPESVRDRTTTAHEFVFHFSKSANTLLWRHREHGWAYTKQPPDYIWRHRRTREESREPRDDVDEEGLRLWVRVNLWRGFDYYYDADAIAEPSSPDSHARAARGRSDNYVYDGPGDQTIASAAPVAGTYRPAVAGWDKSVGEGRHGAVHRRTVGENSRENVDRVPVPRKPGVNPKAAIADMDGPRPKQNASFSEALGSSELVPFRNKRSVWPMATEAFQEAHFATFPTELVEPCVLAGCPPGGVVLDIFGGSGTVVMVADRHQRDGISMELNPAYVTMQENRLKADAGLFYEATTTRAAE